MADRTREVVGDQALPSAALVSKADALRRVRPLDYRWILSSPLMLPLILIVTFAVFAPSLQTFFQADDFIQLRGAQATPTATFIVQALDYRDTRPVPEFGFYRPFFLITFRFCYAVFGLNPFGYHLLSVFLHLGSVVLVWLIVRRLLRSVTGANFSALVFALHPASTEAVQWIARSLDTDPTTFFYLLTMLVFMKYTDGGRYRTLYYAASVLGFATSVLYHTTALSLMAVLPAYVFLITGKPSDALQLGSWVRFTPFLAMTGVMALVQHRVGLGDSFQTGTFQYSSFGRYLGIALFPILPLDWRHLPVFSFNLLLHLYLAASLVMIAATLLLLDRRRQPYIGVFAVVWLYALLAPNTTSLLVDPLTGIIPPQLYLPGTSLGLFFVLAAKEGHEILPPAVARRAASCLPFLLAVLFVCCAALTLLHEHRDTKFAHENQTFISQLQALPPAAPGATLYVVNAPLNLVALVDVALHAAVRLYYGDVKVERVSPEQAAYIKAVDPAQLVIVYRP